MMKATPKEKKGDREERERDRETEETEKGKLSPGGLSGRGATWSHVSIHHWELSPVQQVAMIKMMMKMMMIFCCCSALALVL